MKNLIILAAAGLAGVLVWQYWKQNKSSVCGCKEETVSSSVSAPGVGLETMAGKPSADVQTYETSPMKTFNTPDRLIVKSKWPTDSGQQYVRG